MTRERRNGSGRALRTMRSLQSNKLLLAILAILSRAGAVASVCTLTKHETGFGDRLQCTNASLASVLSESSASVSAVMVFHSTIPDIPNDAFAKCRQSLESLNMNECGIARIARKAFAGLGLLRKLGLPNNKLSEIRAEWFAELPSLQQLDLSFNRIETIDEGAFDRAIRLRWLDLSENRLSCVTPRTLLPALASIEKIRFEGNPLSYKCRGELSSWLREHAVSYKSGPHGAAEGWLDGALWLCADYMENATELDTRKCLLLNLFHQLRAALLAAKPRVDARQCADQRNSLVNCVTGRSRRESSLSSATVIGRLLLLLGSVPA